MILRQPVLRDADKAAQAGFGRQQIVKAAVAAALVEVVADRQQIASFVVEERVVDLGEFAALVDQILDQLDPLGRPAARFGAGLAETDEPGVLLRGGRSAVGTQQAINLGDQFHVQSGHFAQARRMSVSADEAAELAIAAAGAGRPPLVARQQNPGGQLMQLFQLFAGGRFERRGPSGSLVVRLGCIPLGQWFGDDGQSLQQIADGQKGRRCMPQLGGEALELFELGGALRQQRFGLSLTPSHLEQHFDRVGQSGDPLGRSDGLVQNFRQAGLERDQMADEIPAVDGGNISLPERGQCPRVVPVQQVTLIALQLFQGAKGGRGAGDQLAGRDVTEIVGGQIRQQREADVRRRGAMGDHSHRMLLIIVGRQPIVVRADKGLEESPGPPGQPVQKNRLGHREPHFAALQRNADQPGDRRREKPKRDQRAGNDHRLRPLGGQITTGRRGDRRREPIGPQRTQKVGPALPFGFAGRAPLQQMPVGDREPDERAQDRVEIDHGRVRQKSQREQRLSRLAGSLPQCRSDVHPQRPILGFAEVAQHREQIRDHDRRDHHQRPESEVAQSNPSQQRQGHQCAGNQAAPQVVENLPARNQRQRIGDGADAAPCDRIACCRITARRTNRPGPGREAESSGRSASRRESNDDAG